MTESQAQLFSVGAGEEVAFKEAAAAAAGIVSHASPHYLRPKQDLKFTTLQGASSEAQQEAEQGDEHQNTRPQQSTTKPTQPLQVKAPPVPIKREPLDDSTRPKLERPDYLQEMPDYPAPIKQELPDYPAPIKQELPDYPAPIKQEQVHGTAQNEGETSSRSSLLGDAKLARKARDSDAGRKACSDRVSEPADDAGKLAARAPPTLQEGTPKEAEAKPTLLAAAGVVSPQEQNGMTHKNKANKAKRKADEQKESEEEKPSKKKPGRPKGSGSKAKGKPESKAETTVATSGRGAKCSGAKKRKVADDDSHDDDASEATQHYTPKKPTQQNKSLKKSLKATKKPPAPKKKEKQAPKKNAPVKKNAKPSPKKKGKTKDIEAERKALLSRKSCAYVKAKKAALNNGSSKEEACAAGKAATRLTNMCPHGVCI